MAVSQRNLHNASDEDRRAVLEREAIIRPLARADRCTPGDIENACAKLGLSRSRVYRLVAIFRANQVTSSLLHSKPGPASGLKRLPDDVEALIDACIKAHFRTRQRAKVSQLVDEVRHECRRMGVKAPHYRTIKRRIDQIDPKVLLRDRHGAKAAADRYRPVVAEYSADYALQVVQIDHTRADIFIVDEVHRCPIHRPWLTLLIDIASRMVVGFYVSLEAPSATSVALACHHAVTPKTTWLEERGVSAPWPVYGLPDVLHLDNAAEFKSKALQVGVQEHGIDLQYRPVATPHYGGHIERLIGTMMGEVHLLPGTTFSNVKERGDYDSEKHAVMTLREFEQWLTIQIVGRYHAEIHSSLLMPPNASWAQACAARPHPLRQPADAQKFFYDFLPFEWRKVRRDGLSMFNIHYQDGLLSVWGGKLDRKLRVKYDPRDLSAVFLEAPDGRHWPIRYRDLARPPITLWEHRQARKALRDKGIRAVDEQLIFDAVEAQRMIVAEASRRTKSARRQAQRTSYALTDAARMQPQLPEDRAIRAPRLPEPAIEDRPVAAYPIEEWS